MDGQVTSFNNELQLNIKKIRIADEGEYSEADYMPFTKKDIEQMYKDLMALVESLDKDYYKVLLKKFFAEDPAFVKEFKNHSAAPPPPPAACLLPPSPACHHPLLPAPPAASHPPLPPAATVACHPRYSPQSATTRCLPFPPPCAGRADRWAAAAPRVVGRGAMRRRREVLRNNLENRKILPIFVSVKYRGSGLSRPGFLFFIGLSFLWQKRLSI